MKLTRRYIYRCLEEGAEEFFLKPVQKSDVNKLTHMMKTKCKNQEVSGKQGEQETQESTETSSPETTSSSSLSEKSDFESQPQQQQPQTPPNSNKRKPVEEGLSPERTRPRYNGLTVMSN